MQILRFRHFVLRIVKQTIKNRISYINFMICYGKTICKRRRKSHANMMMSGFDRALKFLRIFEQ